MKHISEVLQKLEMNRISKNNDINVNSNKTENNVIIDNNVNIVANKPKKKTALDKTKFTPNTPESQLAEEMASKFEDLDNFAFYQSVVKKLKLYEAQVFFKTIVQEIEDKKNTFNFSIRQIC